MFTVLSMLYFFIDIFTFLIHYMVRGKMIKQKELNKILRLHQLYLAGDSSGQRADLRCVNLIGADLSRTNLRCSNLGCASLSNANLSEADLSWSDLTGATLIGADLSGADLGCSNLSHANLHGANLSGANLIGTITRWVNLTGADLSGANLIGASLRFTNLSGAKLPQGCKYHVDLPKHDILIIHDVAHIGCRSMPLTEWLKHGPEIGRPRGYTEDQIDLYMEILRREHEARRAK